MQVTQRGGDQVIFRPPLDRRSKWGRRVHISDRDGDDLRNKTREHAVSTHGTVV